MQETPRRRVLLTGGTGSVGRALLFAFSKSGYEVAFQYHSNVPLATRLEAEFSATGIRLPAQGPLPPDFSAHYDVLVNNAGINITDSQPHEVSFSDWRVTMSVNLDFPFQLIQRCIPHMLSTGWGRIVNISSIWGLRATTENLPYTVSKHAMRGLTTTVAKEYAGHGVTCNEICPGPIYSEMITRIANTQAGSGGATAAEYIASLEGEIPSGRLARPEDIAALAVFLASDAAGQINGTSIPVDGGYIA